MSSETLHVATYPTEDQYERWKARAEELDVSCSQFMQDMIEAGMKTDRGFDTTVQPDESVTHLRRERNELSEELERAHERIEELEEQTFHAERRTVRRYVENNPGASTEEIIEHLRATVADRVVQYLDEIYADLDADCEGDWHADRTNRGDW